MVTKRYDTSGACERVDEKSTDALSYFLLDITVTLLLAVARKVGWMQQLRVLQAHLNPETKSTTKSEWSTR